MAEELVLMENGVDRMYVPAEKAQGYLAQGWVEISRKPRDSESVAVETTAPELSAPVDAAPGDAAPGDKSKKK